ncbi:MAG: family transporter protein, partial [Verrucomicrobiales bacterium]|nr:family transporter protein [Verrucomicrobiales bacterium]
MTFLPIVARELRVASRRRGAWLTRVSAAFIGIAIGTFVLLAEAGEQPAQLGKELFTTVAGFLFVYTTIAGALVTCDCLSEEKREGTMGLLFLTDLKGYDVVLGKLAATSLNTIYGMLAVVPLMAIPILLGGVSNAEFWRVVIVAINLLMFSLGAGIFASSVSRSDHRAMFLSFVIVGAVIVVPWLLSMERWGQANRPIEWLAVLSPAFGCFTALDDSIRNPQVREAFWTNAACTQVYFWAFILIACRVVPRSWQETGQRTQSRGVFGFFRDLLEGHADARAKRRTRMLEVNPYLWRAARHRTKNLLVWTLIIGAAFFWLATRPNGGDGYFEVGRDIFVIVMLHAALKWWVTSEACRHLSDDRRSGG